MKIKKVILLSLLCLVLCSSDKNLVVTWDKYDIAGNPDIQRLSLWEVNPDTNWIWTISDNISPHDTMFSFIVPDADAHGTRYFVMVAVDSSQNRSDPSNVASITFKLDAIKNLKVQIK
jgi:hypothetical protein